MIRLMQSVQAWGRPEFETVFKRELGQLDAGQLPLQQGLSTTSYARDQSLSVMLIGASADEAFIHAKVGVFYTGIVAGCSCADDPTPVDEENQYCVLDVDIDKASAVTSIRLSSD